MNIRNWYARNKGSGNTRLRRQIDFVGEYRYLQAMNLILVFIGGGIGAAGRYWLQGFVYRYTGPEFPYGTLAVNVLGCVAIGFLMTFFQERFMFNPSLRTFLAIGVLGGFTTFSTFSYETLALLREGTYTLGFLNVASSLMLCLGGTWLGGVLGRLF